MAGPDRRAGQQRRHHALGRRPRRGDEAWDRVWAETLQVNVLAPARLLRNAVRHFRERGGGTVITVSSWAAQRGSTNPDTIAYAASKAAIRAATQTIARGCAKDNILAYIVAPGVVRTRMSEAFAATQGGEAAVSAGLATGEWVPPEDVGQPGRLPRHRPLPPPHRAPRSTSTAPATCR